MGRLPRGLYSYVGEQGLALSGGERQRLAVARALLKDAPLLVLDEASANLDTITERELMAEIRDLMRDRNTLVVTHRLVALETVERGTHDELVRVGGSTAGCSTCSAGCFPRREVERVIGGARLVQIDQARVPESL